MLKSFLTEKRKEILDNWFSLILKTYPENSAKFFKRDGDRFANPVGASIKLDSEQIFDALVNDKQSEILLAALDNIVRIRAVQQFSASQAVSFIFLLKNSIRSALTDFLQSNPQCYSGLLEMESKIDGMALICFDNYMNNREKLFNLKTDEIKRRVTKLLEREGADILIEKQETNEVLPMASRSPKNLKGDTGL